MRIGLDLDNTIICYDRLFHQLAIERDLIPRDLPATKSAVRDHLRRIGREDEWTAMQGQAYGPRISEAAIFPGAIDFIKQCREQEHHVVIISHKTKRPFAEPDADLHDSALGLLSQRGFFEFEHTGLTQAHVWFELTKEEKLSRIGALACDLFMDDLPEFLLEPAFPGGVKRVLFDPAGTANVDHQYTPVLSWRELWDVLAKEMVRA